MKQWIRAQCETFRFTQAQWGERSNFGPIAGGMHLAQLLWTTSEAVYQALKGVDADIQVRVARATTPREAKRIGRSLRMRSDWDKVKVEAMRLALVAKFKCERSGLRASLAMSRAAHIVEESNHDAWWGAKPVGADTLEGENVLGTLLEELRDGTVPPGPGPAFRLGAYEVRRVGLEIEQRRIAD